MIIQDSNSKTVTQVEQGIEPGTWIFPLKYSDFMSDICVMVWENAWILM